jgi:DNA-directed RNA polymerase specialized sigma24 family protein
MAQFPSTQWSLIRLSGETPQARHAAFGQLALRYRPAILAFFRGRLRADEADDATQSFLALSYEHAWWSRADADAGSFRSFLLMLLHRHLGHRLSARKDVVHDPSAIDQARDPSASPEQQFDTRFALVLTARALEALRLRYCERGRGALFEQLTQLLGTPPEHGELKAIAESMQLPANTLTIELKRLRSRLHEQLRQELMELCADGAAFEREWTSLQHVLRGA